jgi:Amidohydrolase
VPEPPSTYYYGRVFGCFTADRVGLRNIDVVGQDNLCFETDYPHTETTWPYSKEYVEKMFADFPEFTDEQIYKILRGNAIPMLDLDRV